MIQVIGMLKKVLSWERDENYDPYKGIEEDLERIGVSVKEAKFIHRFCRTL